MARISTYLNFNGNTEQAFEFYRSVCGGEFTSPMPADAANLVIHAELMRLGGRILMGTGAPESMDFTVAAGNMSDFYGLLSGTEFE